MAYKKERQENSMTGNILPDSHNEGLEIIKNDLGSPRNKEGESSDRRTTGRGTEQAKIWRAGVRRKQNKAWPIQKPGETVYPVDRRRTGAEALDGSSKGGLNDEETTANGRVERINAA